MPRPSPTRPGRSPTAITATAMRASTPRRPARKHGQRRIQRQQREEFSLGANVRMSCNRIAQGGRKPLERLSDIGDQDQVHDRDGDVGNQKAEPDGARLAQFRSLARHAGEARMTEMVFVERQTGGRSLPPGCGQNFERTPYSCRFRVGIDWYLRAGSHSDFLHSSVSDANCGSVRKHAVLFWKKLLSTDSIEPSHSNNRRSGGETKRRVTTYLPRLG